MPRLIEVDNLQELPLIITLQDGDMLLLKASGGYIMSGSSLELIGPLTPALMLQDGKIISPMGAPNTIIFMTRKPGISHIKIISGDPFYAPVAATMEVRVER